MLLGVLAVDVDAPKRLLPKLVLGLLKAEAAPNSDPDVVCVVPPPPKRVCCWVDPKRVGCPAVLTVDAGFPNDEPKALVPNEVDPNDVPPTPDGVPKAGFWPNILRPVKLERMFTR